MKTQLQPRQVFYSGTTGRLIVLVLHHLASLLFHYINWHCRTFTLSIPTSIQHIMARFQLCLMRSKLIVVCFLGALFLSLANATSSVMNRTPLAATSFNDAEGTHIRVYYQATNGDIRETYYDQSTGWTTRPGADIVGHAKLNTGVAVTSWNNGNEVHLTLSGLYQ